MVDEQRIARGVMRGISSVMLLIAIGALVGAMFGVIFTRNIFGTTIGAIIGSWGGVLCAFLASSPRRTEEEAQSGDKRLGQVLWGAHEQALKGTVGKVLVLPQKRVMILVKRLQSSQEPMVLQEMNPEAEVGGQVLEWGPERKWRLESVRGWPQAETLVQGLALKQARVVLKPRQTLELKWNPGQEQTLDLERLQELKQILRQMIEEAQ